MWGFCLYMTFIYLPYDIFFKQDEEVWFGFMLHGWAATLTEPLHWLIYVAGTYGFWKMTRWMWPWAAVYVAQIAVAMLVWNWINPEGGGWIMGVVSAAVLAVMAIALWRAKNRFGVVANESQSGRHVEH